MSRNSNLLAALLATLACASLATAQQISWGAVMPTLGPNDVSLNGTLIAARNLHVTGAVQTATVNGVTFTGGFAPSGWGNASTLALQGSTTGDAGYDILLSGARATSTTATANPTGWGAIRVDNLGALTVGRVYEIQCWFTDQRPGTGTNAIYDRTMTLSSTVGAVTLLNGDATNLASLGQGPLSGPLDADPDNCPVLGTPDVVFGSHCTGVFSWVNATDQLWLLIRGAHPLATSLLRPHLTALQIRELPPGTVQASVTAYGTGCGGLSLSLAQRPVVNSSIGFTTAGITPSTPFGALVLGLNPLSPAVDLTNFGMPGCFQYHDMVTSLLYLPLGGSSAVTYLTLPNFMGAQLQAQSFNYDPAAGLTLLGAVSSNGLSLVLGN